MAFIVKVGSAIASANGIFIFLATKTKFIF